MSSTACDSVFNRSKGRSWNRRQDSTSRIQNSANLARPFQVDSKILLQHILELQSGYSEYTYPILTTAFQSRTRPFFGAYHNSRSRRPTTSIDLFHFYNIKSSIQCPLNENASRRGSASSHGGTPHLDRSWPSTVFRLPIRRPPNTTMLLEKIPRD
jgi:hypothetical protein